MKRSNKIGKDVVVILVSTCITILAWVGFEVYRAYFKPTIPGEVEKYLTPLSPSLDTQILDILEGKV
ncbi:MAG: hypothetical protein G01um101416_810 [Microgenomates group bacterium Gr01-1014_16]|nr:MAG: hypothetical protein G01um101416_810 [Microgenomates group bacterium Gr01-1014_16]